MRVKKIVAIVAASLALALVLSACGKKTDETTTTAGSKEGVTTVIGTDTNGSDSKFEPNMLDFKAGEKVTVDFKNEGTVQHTFTINDWKVDSGYVDPGKNKEVAFVVPADAAGKTIPFICIPHEAQGMVGTIKVS